MKLIIAIFSHTFSMFCTVMAKLLLAIILSAYLIFSLIMLVHDVPHVFFSDLIVQLSNSNSITSLFNYTIPLLIYCKEKRLTHHPLKCSYISKQNSKAIICIHAYPYNYPSSSTFSSLVSLVLFFV
jgi:hypothetical protein